MNGHIIRFHPQTQKLELLTKRITSLERSYHKTILRQKKVGDARLQTVIVLSYEPRLQCSFILLNFIYQLRIPFFESSFKHVSGLVLLANVPNFRYPL